LTQPTRQSNTFKILKRAVCSVFLQLLFVAGWLENCAIRPLTYQNVLLQATSMEASQVRRPLTCLAYSRTFKKNAKSGHLRSPRQYSLFEERVIFIQYTFTTKTYNRKINEQEVKIDNISVIMYFKILFSWK
jgi:hypothetical protein